MDRAYKVGGTVTIYFGDSMRKLLRKSLRKKNTYFVDYAIIAIEGDILTVFPNSKENDEKTPCEVTGLRINKNDRHIMSDGELDNLRNSSKSELYKYAEEHDYNTKEFKEALKPFRKGSKKDD
ncbi:MAG: hypothetical protein IKG01_03750 [Lachnospiraceae bacterium]|nr:hypothetical protein [Lachnospiraceae bacterium]